MNIESINLIDYELHHPYNINIIEEENVCYDIEVEDNNTFFVKGAYGDLLTHNCDGIHIKGLLLNAFHHFWPELLKTDFLYEFITPIVKVSKGKDIKYFYRHIEYKNWKEKTNTSGWFIKYYKGLGTILPIEAKEFFKHINKHLVPITWKEPTSSDLIDMVFNKKRANDRKDWLLDYKGDTTVDKFGVGQTVDQFIKSEMIQFSMADNIRSIPSVYDGFKPSQRKVLYTVIKKNIKNEVKVSMLAGAITELTAYHHGACLDYDTLINLADGTQIEIGYWAENFPNTSLLVKCINDNNNETISIGHSARVGQETKELYEIELEDGTIIKCTGNHPFYVNGQWINAEDLNNGMDLCNL